MFDCHALHTTFAAQGSGLVWLRLSGQRQPGQQGVPCHRQGGGKSDAAAGELTELAL